MLFPVSGYCNRGLSHLLLVPIAFGMLLVNIYPDIIAEPYADAAGIEHAGGLLHYFYLLDEWSILPSLIFLGVGAMTDFGPLIANPISFLLGAAAQFGIFGAYFLAIADWALMIRQQLLFPSSVEPTDRHPFSLPESLDSRD